MEDPNATLRNGVCPSCQKAYMWDDYFANNKPKFCPHCGKSLEAK